MSDIHPAWLIVFSLGISVIPLAAALVTSFVKVSIVLNVLKSAFGAQGIPSGLIVMALSLVVSAYVMSPVVTEMVRVLPGQQPTVSSLPQKQDFEKFIPALSPLREFLSKHTGEKERVWLMDLRKRGQIGERNQSKELTFAELCLGFLMSELRESFSMAFVVLLPFLVVDLIVANILVGLGMYMVSPVMIALPLKLLLFVAADGWLILLRGLILSYGVS